MLISMTGHGEGTAAHDQATVTVEIRATNNRYLKFTSRLPEGYLALEQRLEKLIRESIRRGAVHLALKITHAAQGNRHTINLEAVRSYLDQLASLPGAAAQSQDSHLAAILGLPGVIDDSVATTVTLDELWPTIKAAVESALAALQQMRADEGSAMALDLEQNLTAITTLLGTIEARVPEVAAAYQSRLLERINSLLEEHALTIAPADVVREVGLFVDRSDISEELVRLRSHVEQFRAEMALDEPQGRKLDFLTQEMFREANTIGSKSNDNEVATGAIAIKTTIERMREMIQNVQ